MAEMKNPIDHAEPTKVERQKKQKKTQLTASLFISYIHHMIHQNSLQSYVYEIHNWLFCCMFLMFIPLVPLPTQYVLHRRSMYCAIEPGQCHVLSVECLALFM